MPCETYTAFTFPSHKPASFPQCSLSLSCWPDSYSVSTRLWNGDAALLQLLVGRLRPCGVSGSPLPIEYCLSKQAQGTDQSPDCIHPFLQGYFSTSSIMLYSSDAGLDLLEINICVVLDRGLGRAGVG